MFGAMTRWSIFAAGLAAGLAAVLVAAGCDRKQPAGLAPADDWPNAHGSALMLGGSDEPAMPVAGGGIGPLAPRGGLAAEADDPHGGGAEDDDPHGGMAMDPTAANPHAGMAMDPTAANPHAGMAMDPTAANPHGGMDPGGDPPVDNPHGGVIGQEVVDPGHVVRGVIELGAAAAGKAKPGTAVFVIAKHPDAQGKPAGALLGVQRVDWPATGDAAFTIEGPSLEGDVVVTAHYDQDGEVRSTDPGDLLGAARVTVPSDKLVITLDTVAP
jgi:hypothetical protein